MTKTFRGSYTVAITPFTEDGSAIDVAALKRFLDWQVAVGVPGVIILGTTGEFLTVTDAERELLVDTTVKHVAGRMDVLVGTMNAHTPNAVRYSREAEELGAAGLMIVPPYYVTPTDDERVTDAEGLRSPRGGHRDDILMRGRIPYIRSRGGQCWHSRAATRSRSPRSPATAAPSTSRPGRHTSTGSSSRRCRG